MSGPQPSSRRRPRWRRWLVAYALLLAVSNGVALLREPGPPRSVANERVAVPAFDAAGRREGEVELAYFRRPTAGPGVPYLLLHGSPGSSADFAGLIELLPPARGILAPDLPGFGASGRDVPDYSIAAHARYALALLEARGVERVHLVGFSMGGGVALELAALAPERVASLSMVSSIGVQELELFGSYELNHAVHGAQVGLLTVAPWLVPHFGVWTGRFFGMPYARNFFDTDQRPLRGILERLEVPTLIVHGKDDFLVPEAAALEHRRIVPQSRLAVLDGSHFILLTQPERVAPLLEELATAVEAGEAPRRGQAEPERVAASAAPFDAGVIPPFTGPTLLVAFLLIAVATFVSEDLTCIATGLLVAEGRLSFLAGTAACFVGIFVGDVLLYLGGRLLGRPALERAPLSWFVRPAAVERAAAWFRARGGRVVFLSRFVPGTRLPTYVAAGIVRQPLLVFAGWFVLAGLLWTPVLVGFSAWAGAGAREVFDSFQRWALPGVVLLALGILLLQRLVVPLFSARGRRLLVGRWRRITRWEFWPPYVFYAPVLLRVAWLGLRHRGLGVMTAVNPGIPSGGFVGESKASILSALPPERVARFVELPAALSPDERRERARTFLEEHGLPLVLKPDVGERGRDVRVLHDAAALDRALEETAGDSLLQEHVAGREYGLFWIRRPSEERGRIFSITEKRLPTVVGDGERTLEELILADERAVAAAAAYFEANAERLADVVESGRAVRLVEVGTHCRGAIFLDGGHLATEELARALDRTSAGFEGFYFGRYDAIAADEDALRRGEFRVIELNGLTSEATHVYDPRHGLLEAWRVLFEQWTLAFEIGAENVARGARPTPLADLVREVVAARRRP